MLDIYKQRRMYKNVYPFLPVGFEWRVSSLKGLFIKSPWNAVIKHLLSTYYVTPRRLGGRDTD